MYGNIGKNCAPSKMFKKNMIAQEENYIEENESYSTDKECHFQASVNDTASDSFS